jgi:hypothetical protein
MRRRRDFTACDDCHEEITGHIEHWNEEDLCFSCANRRGCRFDRFMVGLTIAAICAVAGEHAPYLPRLSSALKWEDDPRVPHDYALE